MAISDRDNLYWLSRCHHVSGGRWLGEEVKGVFTRTRRAYDPNARDADRDRIVQEGTPWARPATRVEMERRERRERRADRVPSNPAFDDDDAGGTGAIIQFAAAGSDEDFDIETFDFENYRGEVYAGPQTAEGIPIDTPFPKVTYGMVAHLHAGVKQYLDEHPEYDDGELRDSYDDVMADPDTQREIARVYHEQPDWDPAADASYDQFRAEVEEQYAYLTGELGIRHEVVDYDPYPNVQAMIEDIRRNGRLKTLSTAKTGSHADASDEANDHMRAVHDAFGHAASGRGFDRHGEEAAYQAHAAMFSSLAQGALMTEFRAQAATLIVDGVRAPQKHALLPPEMRDINYRVATKALDLGEEKFAARRARRRAAAFIADARDPDADKLVQEGTVHERPAGAKAPKAPGKPAAKPAATRVAGAKPPAKPTAAKPAAADVPPFPGLPKSMATINLKGTGNGTGTPEDPILVGNDLDKAIELIGQGKSVRLDQPDEVATLVDRLGEIVADAKAKGKDAPLYNLCLISVQGTNLFCKESKGIPRKEMPQLAGVVPDDAPAAKYRRDPNDPNSEADISRPFVAQLKTSKIKVTRKMVKASHLRASQNELNGAKVARLADYIEEHHTLPPGTVFVTRDNYVLDGHHRWAAGILEPGNEGFGDFDVDVEMIDMDIGAALDFAKAFAAEMGVPQADVGKALRLTDHYVEAPSGLWLPWDAVPFDLGAEVKAGGADRNRGNAEQLRRYWTHGEGALKIRWGQPGDFKRCVRAVERHMPGRAEGYCANRHKEALGVWPGQEHGGRKKHHKSEDWESDQDVQDILLAEDAAMAGWLEDNQATEVKAINIGTIFDLVGWVRRLGRDSESWFQRIYSDFGKRAEAKTRDAFEQVLMASGEDRETDPNDRPFKDFDVELPHVATAITEQVNRIVGVNDVLYGRITDTLAEGEARGETMPQLQARVRQVFSTSKARAMAIARTEVTAAANSAQMEAARLNGATTKTWLSAHDDRTRASHVLIDRHTVDIDDHYPVPLVVKGVPTGIVPMEYPGDPQAPPGLTVNCRCTQAYGFGLRYPGAVESDDWFKAHGL